MIPTGFKECNKVFGPPPGMTSEECGNLPVQVDGVWSWSVWELSDEDLELLINTRKIKVGVMLGGAQPPLSLAIYQPS